MKAEKVVKVKWVDSMSDNGRWTLAEDIDMKPTERTTYGFLVEANEEFITVAQTLGMEPEQYCQMMCIPAKSITHYWVIEDHGKSDGGETTTEAHSNGRWSDDESYESYYGLFIVTPEEKMTPFEEKLIQFSDERNSMECDNLPEDREDEILTDHLHRKAAELLALARKELLSEKMLIEQTYNPDISKAHELGMEEGIMFGKAEALKNLPRKKIWLRLLSRISNKISSYVSRQIIKSLNNNSHE